MKKSTYNPYLNPFRRLCMHIYTNKHTGMKAKRAIQKDEDNVT